MFKVNRHTILKSMNYYFFIIIILDLQDRFRQI